MGGDDIGVLRKLTCAVDAVPAGQRHRILTANTLGHRLLLCLEVRKRLPCNFQGVLSFPLRSCCVSVEKDTVDLQHVMVRCVRRNLQVRSTLECDHGVETFRFRAEVQRRLVMTIHTKNSRSSEGSVTGPAFDGAMFTG
jgi:hypothetical protein